MGKRLGRVAAGIFIFVGCFELGLRALTRVAPNPLRTLLSEAARIPLSNVRVHAGLKGGVAILLPPPRKVDVAFVGDSFPFGTYVRGENTFPEKFGAFAKKAIVNLSVGSQSPPEYNRLVEVASLYSPDTTYYCIFANDFRFDPTAVRTLSRNRALTELETDTPMFRRELSSEDRLGDALKRISNLSLAYQLRKLFQQPLITHQSIPFESGKLFFQFASREYWDPLLSYQRVSVRARTDEIVSLAAEARRFVGEWGGKLVVVLLPPKEIVYAPWVGDLREKITEPYQRKTYEQLMLALEHRKIEAVDFTALLQEKAGKGVALYHSIDGHFNETGHEVVATELARLSPLHL